MRGAQIRKPFHVLRLHSLKYAARNPQNSLTDQTRSKPPNPHPIKPSSSQPCSRMITMGRRQRIPSSPIHISKNKPDQPASTPLTESIHLPVQHQLLKASRAKNPGARNLSKPTKNRKKFFRHNVGGGVSRAVRSACQHSGNAVPRPTRNAH